jgi:cytochrome c oxidase subunit 1/cytochrome c oxidase subunit I+III
VLLGINVFPVIGGIHYWFPKFFGRMMDERLGKWSFWVMFIGFNAGFFPMHISGLLGMPRRIYTYAPEMGWHAVNLVTTVGSFVFALGVLMFIVNVLWSLKRGAPAGANPWDAPTLEWSVPSPPPAYNFAVIPFIESRHPLWESRLDEAARPSRLDEGYLLTEGRETIGSSALDAVPDVILKMPGDAWSPFWLALFLSLALGCLLLHAWWSAALMTACCAGALLAWIWPEAGLLQRPPPAVSTPSPVPATGAAHG